MPLTPLYNKDILDPIGVWQLAIEQARTAEIIAQYYPCIYAFCRSRLIDPQDAQDVTQDVFLAFCRKKETVDPEKVKAWLFGAAHRMILHERRDAMKRSRFVSYEDLDEEAYSGTYDLDDLSDFDDDRVEAIRKCILSRLSPEEQQLFSDLYERHRKRAELAEEMQITESALNMRSLRLRRKLRHALDISVMALLYMYVKLRIR